MSPFAKSGNLALAFSGLVLLAGCGTPSAISEPEANSSGLSAVSLTVEPLTAMESFQPASGVRRPTALALIDSGTRLLVANSERGSISVVDTADHKVIAEVEIGESLADFVVVPDSDILLTTDRAADELLSVRRVNGTLEVVGRVSVNGAPTKLALSAEGDRAYVSSVWARQLTAVDVSSPDKPKVLYKIDLPFSPGIQQMLPDGKHLVVLDAFGGMFGVIDVQQQQLKKTRRWNAHNLRGVALSTNQQSLLVPHQALMSDAATSYSGVHWGAVLMNVIRTVELKELFAEKPPVGASLTYVGDEQDAAGDPTGILLTEDNRQIVALAGTSEVVVSGAGTEDFTRIEVGSRPLALALSENEQQLFVANSLSDSVSVIDLPSQTVIAEVELGPDYELTLAQQGERLFYDAHLSADRWFSCHSCHTDGHSNGLLNDNFGDGSAGAPKRVLSLLGVADTGPWAWNGKRDQLEEQVRASILTTMRGAEPSEETVNALTAYLLTLQPAPSVAEARETSEPEVVVRGSELFEQRGCADCHAAPLYTETAAYDVGIHDKLGNKEFNPPSLRGVSQRDRLFHDNRAATLTEVFAEHEHGLSSPLSEEELQSLVSFLQTL